MDTSTKSKVAFATGSRADYGIVRRYLKLLDDDPAIDLSILVTGALLEQAYGHQVDIVKEDGFSIGVEVPLGIDSLSEIGVAHSMARALEGFSDHFADNKYDLLIILGDRYEMLSVATAAAMQRIPILHIHGGEATFANYDEFIRHAITKMSLYHFTATEEYRRRVIQLGEEPDRVFNLGALGAENCLVADFDKPPSRPLPQRDYFVVLFHPETMSAADPLAQTQELLGAISELEGYDYVFIGSNADTHSDVVRAAVQDFVASNDNAHYYENLRTRDYHHLVQHAQALVGNSSSGLIEAPSLGVCTINIGHRQDGRVRGKSVLDVKCLKDEISIALRQAGSMPAPDPLDNPYYQPQTAEKYHEKTCEILNRVANDASMTKVFWDMPMEVFIDHK